MFHRAPAQSATIFFSDADVQYLYANAVAASVPAQPACAPQRKRNRQPKPKPYAHTQATSASPSSSSSQSASSASPSASSSSSSPPPHAKRWPCCMPGCTKSYGRSHDLVRHLDTSHHSALAGADDSAILAAGVPPNQVARVRELLARRNACSVCGESFSRRDALVRHMDEQGHRTVAAPAAPAPAVPTVVPPPGYQWALVPVSEASPPPAPPPPPVDLDTGLFMSPLDMHLPPFDAALALDALVALERVPPDIPAAPLLRDEDVFAFPEAGATPVAVPDMPSLHDWEVLISSWAHAQS
ncbi:hypothetical protein AURDEDRAFT_113453 [Auricularia subglabra TFB-10046 SS5]|nr:hypothetical protein AURDEDRAFT_113453 [Auricularia subglabra TFB-10046 SS5]